MAFHRARTFVAQVQNWGQSECDGCTTLTLLALLVLHSRSRELTLDCGAGAEPGEGWSFSEAYSLASLSGKSDIVPSGDCPRASSREQAGTAERIVGKRT